MKNSLRRLWRWVKWPLLVLAVAYVGLLIYRVPAVWEKEHNPELVAKIHATRLSLADVEGSNLPPVPDQAENDATLVGVDKNNNGIRDDVELAIFKKYPADKKTRAAALQYALELQMEFTKVINSATLVAVLQEESRGFACIYGNEKFVEQFVLNTTRRKQYREDILNKYLTSYILSNEKDCDITV